MDLLRQYRETAINEQSLNEFEKSLRWKSSKTFVKWVLNTTTAFLLAFSIYTTLNNFGLQWGCLNIVRSCFLMVNIGYFIVYDNLSCDCLSKMYQKDKYFAAISYLICQQIASLCCYLWFGESFINIHNGKKITAFHLFTMCRLIKSGCILAIFSFAVSPQFGNKQLHYIYTFLFFILEFIYQNISIYIKKQIQYLFKHFIIIIGIKLVIVGQIGL